MKDLLVFVRAGKLSLHREWSFDKARVEVVVSAYAPGVELGGATRVVEGGYNKFSHFVDLVQGGSINIADYRYFFLVDDDIEIDWPLERLVDLVAVERADVSQPALRWGAFLTFPFLLRNPFCRVREVAFVEVMCPVFGQDALRVVLPSFAMSRSTWGVDIAFSALAAKAGMRLQVLDALSVTHCKEISLTGGAWYSKLRTDGVDPQAELDAIRERYGDHRLGTRQFVPRVPGTAWLAAVFERGKPWLRRCLAGSSLLRVRRL